MNTDHRTTKAADMKVMLSTLWVFLSLNYIFCDVLSNMESETLKGLLTGYLSGIQLNQGFLLAAGISLEIPFVMVVLSRVLKFRANRWTNIIAGLLMAAYQAVSFFFGSATTLHYAFFSIVEISGNLFIVLLAWKWHNHEENSKQIA